jgi:putative membrane protein
MWWNEFWPMPWMFFGPIMMLIFFALCMTMMWFMMRGGMHKRLDGGHATEILKERFAKGEINQAEYEERLRILAA